MSSAWFTMLMEAYWLRKIIRKYRNQPGPDPVDKAIHGIFHPKLPQPTSQMFEVVLGGDLPPGHCLRIGPYMGDRHWSWPDTLPPQGVDTEDHTRRVFGTHDEARVFLEAQKKYQVHFTKDNLVTPSTVDVSEYNGKVKDLPKTISAGGFELVPGIIWVFSSRSEAEAFRDARIRVQLHNWFADGRTPVDNNHKESLRWVSKYGYGARRGLMYMEVYPLE